MFAKKDFNACNPPADAPRPIIGNFPAGGLSGVFCLSRELLAADFDFDWGRFLTAFFYRTWCSWLLE